MHIFLYNQKIQKHFGIIADFFVQKRKNNKYVPSYQQIKYVNEFLKLMKAITGDKKYTDINSKRGVKNMCDVLQGAIAEGRTEGELIGTARHYTLT